VEDLRLADFKEIDWEKVRGVFTPEKESFLKKARAGLEKYPQAEEALKILAALGVVSLVVIMPGLGKFIAKQVKYQEKARYQRMWKRWQEQRLVEIDYSGSEPEVKITEKGLKRALRYKLSDLKLKRQKRWDKKWRVIIFDVPEEKKRNRDYFRSNLLMLGCYRLNKSVFVYPYPCFDEVEYLRQVSGIGDEVTYMIAESVENAPDLESNFDLK
jgi:hypothetical protein